MVEARLATKDIDGECANPADRIYVSVEVKASYVHRDLENFG